MEIQIICNHPTKNINPEKIRRKLKKILKGLGYLEGELSLLFTDDSTIAELNRRFLKREGPTNVLAFPMSDGSEFDYKTNMLGDIVVSGETASRESLALGESLEYTIDRLLIHGVLHLLGFDHTGSEEDAVIMEKEEKRLMALIVEE